MKTLCATFLTLLCTGPALADTREVYKYTVPCTFADHPTTCTVVDTRVNGFLHARGIYNDEWRHTFKQRYAPRSGENTSFVSTDNIYTWDYWQPYTPEANGYIRVSPFLTVKGISFD